MTILRLDGHVINGWYYSCTWCHCRVSLLLKLSGCGQVMDETNLDELTLDWSLSVAPFSMCRPCYCWLDTWWFSIGWGVLLVAYQVNLKLNISDVGTWRDPRGLLVTSFRSSKNCHVAHYGWLIWFQCPTLLTINSSIPLLPSHIPHIFFSNISS